MSVIGKGGQSTREALISRLAGLVGGRISGGQFVLSSSGVVKKTSVEQIYGSSQQFMDEYKKFEKMYQAALDTDLSIGKAQNAYVDALRSSETINLKVLNASKADELYNHYINKVLKLPQLLNSEGVPQIEMPSANFFRSAFKYRVEQGQGELHPAQVLLNRTILNFDKNRTGIDSLRVGRSNILSSQAIDRSARQGTPDAVLNILNKMQTGRPKIMTIDVETTGVFETSQVRSISGLEMTYDRGMFRLAGTPAIDLAFESEQLAGLRVFGANNTVKSLNEMLTMVERGGGKAIEMGPGGKVFLDETEKFINRILEADILAGHNIGFDLGKIRQTAMAQVGYSSHRGIQTAMKKLDEKIASGDYVLDTLELARSYLMNQVEELVGNSNLADEALSKKYVSSLFAQETLARVHIGGSASYASVENIALNTNLFELLEKEPGGKADELYDLIRKGSHIAETDTRLQSYIMEFILRKELKITQGLHQENVSEMASWARSRILQSQAITPTTNIADVSWLSQTVFSQFLEEPTMRSNVTLMLSSQELGLQGKPTRGILKFMSGEGNVPGAFKFITEEGAEQIIDDTTAFSVIRNILQQARQESTAVSGSSRLTSQQKAAAKILNLGLTVEQASSIGEVEELLRSKIAQTNIAGQQAAEYVNNMTDAFASVYKTLGSRLSAQDSMRSALGRDIVGSAFQVGMSNYTVDAAKTIAQNFAKIGDPFAYIPMKDRVISTVMAESTASIAKNLVFRNLDETVTPIKLAITETPELLAGMGVSFFEKTQVARLFHGVDGVIEPVQKVILPTDVLDEVVKNVFGDSFSMRQIGRSVVDEMQNRPRTLNAVWLAGREIGKDDARKLATEIITTMGDQNKVANLMKVEVNDLDQSVRTAVGNAANILRGTKESITEASEMLAESIMERGIVMATAGEASEQVIQNMTAVGEIIDNEILMNDRTAARVVGLEDLNAVVVSPYVDRTTQRFVSDQIISEDAYKPVDMVIGTDANGQPIQKKVSRFFVNLNDAAAKVSSDADQVKNLRKRINRSKVGKGTIIATDLYITNKPKIALSMAGLAALGTGYYIAKKHRERQLYDESVEAQPIERATEVDQYNSYSSGFYDNRSYRKDPLVTAGVVGNLDRAKIGHTRMGSDRYNHLFGGSY